MRNFPVGKEFSFVISITVKYCDNVGNRTVTIDLHRRSSHYADTHMRNEN